jgi:pyruvate-formate lyase
MEAKVNLSVRRRLEKELLQKLLTLTLEQRDCLIAGAPDRLGEIVGEQAAVLQKLSRNADKIASLTQTAASGETREPAFEKEVTELARRVKMEARLNCTLAQEAAKYVDFTISALGGQDREHSYSSGGRREVRANPVFMSETA